MARQKGLEIDRRVGIALTVLTPSQKSAVARVIGSSESFALAAAVPGRVQQLHVSGQSLSLMRVSPTLRLIYTMVGDTVYVLDLIERATLERFAVRKAAKRAVRGKKNESKSGVLKSAEVIKK